MNFHSIRVFYTKLCSRHLFTDWCWFYGWYGYENFQKLNVNKRERFWYIILGFVLLVVLRPVGELVLYDPLEVYFQNDYLKKPLPEMNLPLLGLSVSLKYFFNSLVSIGIIHCAFMDEGNTKFSVRIYLMAFVFLMLIFFGLILLEPENSTRLLFYIRRFLMHPLLVLILIPAFYYQELKG